MCSIPSDAGDGRRLGGPTPNKVSPNYTRSFTTTSTSLRTLGVGHDSVEPTSRDVGKSSGEETVRNPLVSELPSSTGRVGEIRGG